MHLEDKILFPAFHFLLGEIINSCIQAYLYYYYYVITTGCIILYAICYHTFLHTTFIYIISTGHTPYSPIPVAINVQVCLPIIKCGLLLFFLTQDHRKWRTENLRGVCTCQSLVRYCTYRHNL